MAQKPSIPKGTRDFSPQEMVRRNYIFSTIRSVFSGFGYAPIETPAMENLSTLMGKYGEEGDKLLFRILNSGDYLQSSGVLDEGGNPVNPLSSAQLAPLITEKGLRYDLTVPFARYVVQHRNEIVFPFKRYQIQPVWRADRPQRGRYREFFQCDVDVIGSTSLLNEVELIQIILEVFSRLSIPCGIRLNNRKILAGIAETIGEPDRFWMITTALDKLDKIGWEKVREELISNGLSDSSWDKLLPFLQVQNDPPGLLEMLKKLLHASAVGMKGIEEMRRVWSILEFLGQTGSVSIDLTLARGLHYYTGTIIEVGAQEVAIGSICGGGRYDDLTGIFGLPGISGVGVSFGADRIYDVLLEKNGFPEETEIAHTVLLVNFGDTEELFALSLLDTLRKAGIAAELYPDAVPLKKQLSYADARKIKMVLLAGTEEISTGVVTLKDMTGGTQQKVSIPELIPALLNI